MKYFKILLLTLLLTIVIPVRVLADENVVPNAQNAILVEVDTGTIIYEKAKDERVSIASLTKMMGLILIFERIYNKTLKYDDKVTASANASGMGGSQIWLETGEVMSVSDLLKGIIMASANDGIVAMAEKVAGTEENFVKLMNERAKELGLKNTNFVNCTGLDEKNHYSTAYDLSIIARELMKYPDVFKYTTNYEDYLRVNTENKFWLVNTNKLIKTYNGADGLKTGMTDDAGYCMAVTAKRDGMRLLAIVLGEKEGKVRNKETANLLDYGFNLYEVLTIKKKGEKVGTTSLDKAKEKNINIILEEDVTILRKKGSPNEDVTTELQLNKLKLPIKKNERIGILLIRNENNEIINKVSVVCDNDIKKTNFFELWLTLIKDVLTGSII